MKTIPEKYVKEPTGFPFPPVIIAEGKKLIFTSGAVCEDWDGTVPADMATQTRNTILACKRVLEEAGASLEDVVYVDANVADLSQWGEFNRVYRELMPEPYPARKAVGGEISDGFLVEMAMFAMI